MAIGVSVSLKWNLRPRERVLDEVADSVLKKLAKGAKNVSNHAKKNHPYQDRTGTNTKSIGWAVSPRGQSTFEALSTGLGKVSAGSIKSNPKFAEALVASTSSYGGFLETGTVNMPAFPYLMPAFNAWKARIMKSLAGIL